MPVEASSLPQPTAKVQQELEAACLDVVREYQGRAGYGALAEQEWSAEVYSRTCRECDAAQLSAVDGRLRAQIPRIALNVYAEALYRKCRSSQPLEQRKAYQELGAYLYRIAYHLVQGRGGTASLAEDFAQDALARIWHSIDGCQQPGAFLKWAAVILVRTTQRSLAREPDHLPNELSPESVPCPPDATVSQAPETPQRLAERQDLVDLLLAAIKELPDTRQRKILLWGFLGDLSDAEIARKLGINRNHVHQLRFRALTTLRRDESLRNRLRVYLSAGL